MNKGESGYITVSYDPMYRPGLFDREVVVTFQSDGKEMIDTLRVLGEVIARPKTLNEQFPYRLDKVQCSCKMIYLKYVDMGTTPSQHLYCHNSSEKPVTMKVTQNHIVEVSEERTIAPGETENFLVTYHSTNGLYGVNMFRLKVILDGDTLMQGINVRAEVKEDFSKLTPKERRKAPIIHALKTPNMTVKRGEQIAYPLTIFNNGLSTLLLRRIVTNGDFITLLTTKNKIKAGRSLNLMLNIDTSKLEPGNYKRKITIISNDPTQPELNHEIEFTVEP